MLLANTHTHANALVALSRTRGGAEPNDAIVVVVVVVV